ncbi:MAG: 1,6-anhydro-N-acetylmuramyl-L-alanine amidase AmpD [Thiomicrorhabdus sp.]|jgi:AmpD protein|nr:1,6-anhydro-N-acetylmuramyl-L-alanine amidase AmpD [Thiomicrorhabdus sp.]
MHKLDEKSCEVPEVTCQAETLFKIETNSGVAQGINFIASPNFDNRGAGVLPELIVVHGISLPPNQFGGEAISQLFTNQLDPKADPYFEKIKGVKVSAHALIRRDGEIVQYVPFHERAWHAGLSEFEGRSKCNDFSIGIEMEGSDQTCYTAHQYAALAQLIRSLWAAYPSLKAHKVVGHNEIAPGRKTDPGPYFQWGSLNRLLEKPVSGE